MKPVSFRGDRGEHHGDSPFPFMETDEFHRLAVHDGFHVRQRGDACVAAVAVANRRLVKVCVKLGQQDAVRADLQSESMTGDFSKDGAQVSG